MSISLTDLKTQVDGLLGDTLYIDNVNNRVGINISNPEQAIDCAGNIKIRSTGVERLIFYDDAGDHINADIDAIVDGTNGGVLGIRTKVNGGSVSEKLRINNVGAIGIGGANYGTSGQVLTSGGDGSAVSWTTPSGGGGSAYYFKSNIVGDLNISRQRFTKLNLIASGFRAPYNTSDSDMTNSIWTCPQAGIYKINLDIFLDGGGVGDHIREVEIVWIDDTTWVNDTIPNWVKVLRLEQFATAGVPVGDEDTFMRWSFNSTDLIELIAGQTLQFGVRIRPGFGSGLSKTFDYGIQFGNTLRSDTTDGRNGDTHGGKGRVIIQRIS